jgi:hypothetical protein
MENTENNKFSNRVLKKYESSKKISDEQDFFK